MLINFISNLPGDIRSGGFSAMNFAACEALRSAHEVKYVGPVNPAPSLRLKAASKFLRLVGQRGNFFFYSQRRLAAIARRVEVACSPHADLDFFHGFTPWVAARQPRPYMTWSDCTFRDYISYFHRKEDFRPTDIARIERAEAAWLKGARQVAFSSDWAAERACADYGLDRTRVLSVGIFGDFEPPFADAYAGDQQFAFVSTNFRTKGGPVVLEAFRKVRERHPQVSLIVVGDKGHPAKPEPGVTYTGFLRKEDPVQYARLREVFATSRAVVNASRSDTAPVLLVEAGYFGCPAISSRSFAIPEIVKDGVSGLLVDDPTDADAVANALAWMLEGGDGYFAMRKAAWVHTRRNHTKAQFKRSLLASVDAALEVTS